MKSYCQTECTTNFSVGLLQIWCLATMSPVQREQDEDQEAFLPKTHDEENILLAKDGGIGLWSTFKAHARLVTEIFMGLLILLLLVHPPSRMTTQQSAVPICMSTNRQIF